MSENEEIKVVKLGDKNGCLFDDLIQIQVSPDWLQEITDVFKEKALNNKNYDFQGLDREKADFFDKAYNTWRKARNEFDNKHVNDNTLVVFP